MALSLGFRQRTRLCKCSRDFESVLRPTRVSVRAERSFQFQARRLLQSSRVKAEATTSGADVNFGFVFEYVLNELFTSHSRAHSFSIDGVLLRGKTALPRAAKALTTLQKRQVPFILLTNGGGRHESQRAEDVSNLVGVPISTSQIIQSHTPFQDMHDYKEGTVLIVGGEYDNARAVAQKYGFKNAITPSDIFKQQSSIWPFSKPLVSYHNAQGNRDSRAHIDYATNSGGLKIDSIFVFNDPRDFGLDLAIIIDLLLSRQGYLGTLSSKNGAVELPNRGYQQDGQPPLFFSNPDLWFAADFNLPRLGQGAFYAALEGVWKHVTGGADLRSRIFGKPYHETYEFAERRLQSIGANRGKSSATIENVYMVGDNPEADIRGAMGFRSPTGVRWHGALVRTGIYMDGNPSVQPSVILDDAWEAVQWGMHNSGW